MVGRGPTTHDLPSPRDHPRNFERGPPQHRRNTQRPRPSQRTKRMRPRTLLILLILGIAALAGGWYFGTSQEPAERQAYNGGKLMFPDLATHLQDADRIEI